MSCADHLLGIAFFTAPIFVILYFMDPDPFGTEIITTLLWSIMYAFIIYGTIYGILSQVAPDQAGNLLYYIGIGPLRS